MNNRQGRRKKHEHPAIYSNGRVKVSIERHEAVERSRSCNVKRSAAELTQTHEHENAAEDRRDSLGGSREAFELHGEMGKGERREGGTRHSGRSRGERLTAQGAQPMSAPCPAGREVSVRRRGTFSQRQ